VSNVSRCIDCFSGLLALEPVKIVKLSPHSHRYTILLPVLAAAAAAAALVVAVVVALTAAVAVAVAVVIAVAA